MHDRSGLRISIRVCGTRGTRSHALVLPGRWRFRPKGRSGGRSSRLTRASGLPGALPERNARVKATLLGKGIFSGNKGRLAEYFSFLWKKGYKPTQAWHLGLSGQPGKGPWRASITTFTSQACWRSPLRRAFAGSALVSVSLGTGERLVWRRLIILRGF